MQPSEDPRSPGIGDVHSNEPGSGARYNAGKPAFELVPLLALEDCARVFGYGQQKYAPWNWAKGMPWSAPLGCLLRHLSAWQRGEDNDPESGLPHLGHAMANLVMLTTYARTYPQGDDRTQWLRANVATGAEPVKAAEVATAIEQAKRYIHEVTGMGLPSAVGRLEDQKSQALRRQAPWPDYAGNPIFEGDWIVHPSGQRARVRFEPRAGSPGFSEWRCDYECGDELPLDLQIGNKGMAVVEKRAAAPEDAERRFGQITSDPRDAELNIRSKEDAERAAYLARWRNAPTRATHLVQGPDSACWWVDRKPYQRSSGHWEGGIFSGAGKDVLGSVCCEPRPVPADGQGVEG